MWSLKKFVTCIRTLLISFYCASATLFQCYSITSPVLFTKNNKLWNERKGNFLNMWLLERITLYQRRQKIAALGTIPFFDTHSCISNPYWQSSEIIIFWCKFYIVISDVLIGSCCWL